MGNIDQQSNNSDGQDKTVALGTTVSVGVAGAVVGVQVLRALGGEEVIALKVAILLGSGVALGALAEAEAGLELDAVNKAYYGAVYRAVGFEIVYGAVYGVELDAGAVREVEYTIPFQQPGSDKDEANSDSYDDYSSGTLYHSQNFLSDFDKIDDL